MWVSFLNFEWDPRVPLLNFEGGGGVGGRGPGVPVLNLKGFPGVPGSRGPGLTFTPCPIFHLLLIVKIWTGNEVDLSLTRFLLVSRGN